MFSNQTKRNTEQIKQLNRNPKRRTHLNELFGVVSQVIRMQMVNLCFRLPWFLWKCGSAIHASRLSTQK